MSLRFISQSHVLTRVRRPFQIRTIGQIESPFLATVHSVPIRRHHTVNAVVNTWQGKPEPESNYKFGITPFISSLSRPLPSPALSVKMNSFTSNQVRTVASSSTSRNEFLCIIPDKPGSLENRLKVRPYVVSRFRFWSPCFVEILRGIFLLCLSSSSSFSKRFLNGDAGGLSSFSFMW